MSKTERKDRPSTPLRADELYHVHLMAEPELLLSVETPRENSTYEQVVGEVCDIDGIRYYVTGGYRKKKLRGLS